MDNLRNSTPIPLARAKLVRAERPAKEGAVRRLDAGATSTDLEYRLKRDGAGAWTLGLDADTPWLRSQDRVWPTAVDPTVDFTEDHDTYIGDGTGADTQYGPASFMEVATGGSQNRRALVAFNLSGIPKRMVGDGGPCDGGGPGPGDIVCGVAGASDALDVSRGWIKKQVIRANPVSMAATVACGAYGLIKLFAD